MYTLIQVLRGVAALLVVLHHSLSPAQAIPMSPEGFTFGAAGVDVFFVISGFIIYMSVAVRHPNAKDFLLKRAIRIFPPYWVATLLLVLSHLTIGMQRDMVLSVNHVVLSFLLIAHDSPTQPGSPYPLLIPGWTLQYEIFFYLLFSVALLITRRSVVAVVAALLFSCVITGIVLDPPGNADVKVAFFVYTNLLLLEFLCGILIGVVAFRHAGRLRAWMVAGLPLGFGLLVFSDHIPLPRIVTWGVPAVLMVLGAVAGEPLVRRRPVPRFFVLLGDASYSIYLTHVLTLGIVRGVFRTLPTDAVWWMPLFLFVSVAASIAAGLVFYRFIEKPLVRTLTGKLVYSPSRIAA